MASAQVQCVHGLGLRNFVVAGKNKVKLFICLLRGIEAQVRLSMNLNFRHPTGNSGTLRLEE